MDDRKGGNTMKKMICLLLAVFLLAFSLPPMEASAEGAAGAHWGLMGTDFALKDCFAGTDYFRGHRGNSAE